MLHFGLRPTRLAQPAALKSSKRIQSRRPAPPRTWNAGRAAPPARELRADQSSGATRRQHAGARETKRRERRDEKRRDLPHTLSNRLRYRSRRTASGARAVLLRAQQVFRRVTSCCSASASVLFCSAALCCTLYCTALHSAVVFTSRGADRPLAFDSTEVEVKLKSESECCSVSRTPGSHM